MSLLDQYRQMHESPDLFPGFSIWPHIERIKRLIDRTESRTVLDYGCGKGLQYEREVEDGKRLAEWWGVSVALYDPAVPGLDALPESACFDGVICTDVLEHAEDDHEARNMVWNLFLLSDRFVFASVSCRPAKKTLPDGRNAHTCLHEPEWWRDLFQEAGGCWKLVCDTDEGRVVFDSEGNRTEEPVKQRLVVQTKNCVENDVIIEHVERNQTRPLPWAQTCAAHGETAVLVGAGPSWPSHLDEIRAHVEAGHRIVAVKHVHDALIVEGIVPWACVLLDPRAHSAEFIENPHPVVRYFVATMVDPAVFDRLEERNARVWMYHALVGAGEDKVAKGGLFVSGGSTSAMRAIPLFRSMGFRKFVLYGFDSCVYDEKPADGMVVEISGRQFVTRAEWVAQSQDFEKLANQFVDCEFDARGPGMIAWVNDIMKRARPTAEFEEVYA